ncbi:MAG: hypothetical protein ACLFO3_04070 [Candidatus Acetothermia bacterium]
MSTVSIIKVRGGGVEDAARETATSIPGFESAPWENSNVLLKPNTVNPSQSGSGIVTDARLVEAVA